MNGNNESDPLTSSEELDNLQAGDNTSEVTLAVVRHDARRLRANAPPPRIHLFRCIGSNLQGREIRILFWENRAREFETRVFQQVIRIHRARITPANPAFIDPTQNLMRIEISVQAASIVEILRPMVLPAIAPAPQFQEVNLADSGTIIGPARVTGYIRVRIEAQTFGNASYGSGAITDLTYHLCVNVATFDERLSPPVGAHVAIDGELRRNRFNVPLLQVTDMSSIHVLDNQEASAAQVRGGFRKIPVDEAGNNPAAKVPAHQAIAPAAKAAPVAPVQPAVSVQPIAPVQLAASVQPIAPVQSVAPAVPVQPAASVQPVAATAPVQPIAPVQPVIPVQPTAPVAAPTHGLASPTLAAINPLAHQDETFHDDAATDAGALSSSASTSVSGTSKFQLSANRKRNFVTSDSEDDQVPCSGISQEMGGCEVRDDSHHSGSGSHTDHRVEVEGFFEQMEEVQQQVNRRFDRRMKKKKADDVIVIRDDDSDSDRSEDPSDKSES